MTDTQTPGGPEVELTVVVVSYNTLDLTRAALRTLYAETRRTAFRCIVYDNASHDGSAETLAREFPQAQVIASPDNIGFAAANNVVLEGCDTPYILLLNPDTEVQDGAVDNLMDFARATPEAGIWGGRTVFRDGSTNIASCWGRITPWSMFCKTFGLTSLLPRSETFNPEAYGGWQRDSEREVDIVVGCFLLIRCALWQELGGFRTKYFMYGEEADLCLRARAMGYRPRITPKAQIMHIVGASIPKNDDKAIMVMRARASLIRDHWTQWTVPYGLSMMWLWSALRFVVTRPGRLSGSESGRAWAARWARLWQKRQVWLAGYE